jgi:uncharacterized protein YcaQ
VTVARLSLARARRVALAAQGFADPSPAGRADRRHLRRVVGRTGLFQIDSVNVLVRAHYLPAFSRLGPYPTSSLDGMAYRRPVDLFEYWAHEASLVPVAMQPLFRWRMHRGEAWGRMQRMAKEKPGYVESVLAEVADRGPLGSSDLTEPGTKHGPWWGWADGKAALEWLFWTGRLAAGGRRNFERLYDLPERVLPAEVLAAPTPDEPDAHRELVRLAARSLGVGTVRDLADYYRLTVPETRPRIAELVEEGALVPVQVEGWRQEAFLAADAKVPRRISASALLAPFDPVVWERSRAERLFGFRYRIEIYTPAPKREFGYYVLPFLLDEAIVARVDLKAERATGTLAVRASHAEPGHDPGPVAEALARDLVSMAGWLGLSSVRVDPVGDLSRPLWAALPSAG